jgi:hypothetical protein
MDILFFNEHQHGDLILGKQNVRWIVDHSPKNVNFYYLHNKHPESVFVHERIKHIKTDLNFHASPMPVMEKFFKQRGLFQDALWVSTWVGSINNVMKLIDENGWERYLLPNDKNTYEIGVNDELWDNMDIQLTLCKQNIDIINSFLISNLNYYKIPYPNSREDMLVKWNSKPKKLDAVNKIIIEDYKLKILICNGQTISNQRENFDYGFYLEEIIKKHTDVLFYFTENVSIQHPNVININEHVEFPNMNEIEYLSKFCNVIVTSLSGPGNTVVNDAVVKDPEKTLIHVCRKIIGLVYDKHLCKCIQTEDYSKENITTIIENAILEKK